MDIINKLVESIGSDTNKVYIWLAAHTEDEEDFGAVALRTALISAGMHVQESQDTMHAWELQGVVELKYGDQLQPLLLRIQDMIHDNGGSITSVMFVSEGGHLCIGVNFGDGTNKGE